MDYQVRHMRPDEYALLGDFLLLAIFVPEGQECVVSREQVMADALCRGFVEGFGTRGDDACLVAEMQGEVVGACWVRTTRVYGHVDDRTPAFAVSVKRGLRGRGIGGSLMRAMLDELDSGGCERATLSVQKENPALRLYERLGFRIVGDGADASEWLMTWRPGRIPGLEVRRLGPADVTSVVELRCAQLEEEGTRDALRLAPELAEHYRRHLADGTFISWVATLDGTIVATSGLSIVERPPYAACPTGRVGIISGMYTVPALRRQGMARDLLLRLLDSARSLGVELAQVTASDMGVGLYGSCGFTTNANFRQLRL